VLLELPPLAPLATVPGHASLHANKSSAPLTKRPPPRPDRSSHPPDRPPDELHAVSDANLASLAPFKRAVEVPTVHGANLLARSYLLLVPRRNMARSAWLNCDQNRICCSNHGNTRLMLKADEHGHVHPRSQIVELDLKIQLREWYERWILASELKFLLI
jgi:hypothetical protein